MKAIDLLKNYEGIIKILRDCGIRLGDIDYINMYAEYEMMRSMGEKVTYIVRCLSERHFVSERKIYEIIKRFESYCTTFTV